MNKRPILVTCILLLVASISFGQAKPKVDLAKKIADATPAELPQSPVPTSVSNDARDAGLKGKVKSVIEFNESDGRLREPFGERYFNESGNLTKHIYFDEAIQILLPFSGMLMECVYRDQATFNTLLVKSRRRGIWAFPSGPKITLETRMLRAIPGTGCSRLTNMIRRVGVLKLAHFKTMASCGIERRSNTKTAGASKGLLISMVRK